MDILAEREGRRAYFHPNTWNRFPGHKYGWALVVPKTPPAVVEAMEAVKQRPEKGRKLKKAAKQSGE